MKRRKTQLSVWILIVSMVFSLMPSLVEASEFNFAVKPMIPENQIDKKSTYFDLKLNQGQKEELKVQLRNDTDKEVEVEISVNSATTNLNGVVEYGSNKIKPDPSLKYNMKDIVEYPHTVKLSPKSEQAVPFKVSMPNEKFDGVLAGGITFQEASKKTEEKDTDKKGLSIKNEYSYVVALLLRQNLNKVEPKVQLNQIKPDQVNARNVIAATIQNDQSVYINQVAIQASITKKGKSEVLYSEDKEGMQMAPNSHFSFPIALKGEPLKPGEYHLSMTVFGNKNDDGQYDKKSKEETLHYRNQWKFEKDFSIDGEVAKKLNKKDVTLKKDYTWLYILLGILLLLVVIVLILWLIWRKKKNEEDQ